jgi:hypothetical protein
MQDALANFIDILPDIPDVVLAKRVDDLTLILMDTLKYAQ